MKEPGSSPHRGNRPASDGPSLSLASSVKEYLGDPADRIRLEDVLGAKLRETIAALAPQVFPANAPPITAETFAERVQRYDAAIEELVPAAIALGRWGMREHRLSLTMITSRLAEVDEGTGGLLVWIGLRWYPAAVLFYCAGVAALAGENYELIGSLFNARCPAPDRDRSPFVFAQINKGLSQVADTFKSMPGHERDAAPRSEFLFQKLRTAFDKEMYLGRSFDELFDRFEALNAVAHMSRLTTDWKWCPDGRFLWKLSDSVEGGPLGGMEAEARDRGQAWPLLASGLFGGSHEQFLASAKEVRGFLGRFQYR